MGTFNATRAIAIGGVIVVAALLVAGLFVFKPHKSAPTGSSKPPASSISHPASWQDQPTNDADISAGIILKLYQSSPAASFIARKQDGRLAEGFTIKTLPDELVAKFSKELKGFKLVSKQVVTVGTLQTAQVRYTQDGNSYLMVVFPTSEQTYYLTFKASTADFEHILPGAQAIVKSFSDYAAH